MNLLLSCRGVLAMNSPPLNPIDDSQELLEVIPVLGMWVRVSLVGLAAGLVLVFSIALWLNPYEENGAARKQETHRQLGLPPCTFYLTTKVPCPSCGMTTSFALLMRGDLLNSMRANFVGTLLATLGLFLIPWALLSAVRKHTLFIRSIELPLVITVLSILGLMVIRWIIVVAWLYYSGAIP